MEAQVSLKRASKTRNILQSLQLIFLTIIISLMSTKSFSQNTGSVKSGYAPVNGLKMYYEIHGEGQPTILIHGGFGSMEMFGANLTELANGRQVIAVDLQAHGRTADIDRPLSFELMADDIAALITHLGFESADVM